MRKCGILLLLIVSSLFAQPGQDTEWRQIEINSNGALKDAALVPDGQSTTGGVVVGAGFIAAGVASSGVFNPAGGNYDDDEDYNGVDMDDNNDDNAPDGFAVGNNGTIVSTKDNGNTWDVSKTGGNNLNDVAVKHNSQTGTTHAWAVGDDATIWYTDDNGYTWSNQSTPYGFDNFFGVHFTDTNTGYIVGTNGIMYKTTDGGNTWVYLDNLSSIPHYQDITFANATKGWACGTNGTIAYTDDGGDTWTQQQTGTTSTLNSLWVQNEDNVWAAGNNGTLLHYTGPDFVWEPIDTGFEDNYTFILGDPSQNNELYLGTDQGNIVTNQPEQLKEFTASQNKINLAAINNAGRSSNTRIFVTPPEPNGPWRVTTTFSNWSKFSIDVSPPPSTTQTGTGYFDVSVNTENSNITETLPHTYSGSVSIESEDGSNKLDIPVDITVHPQGQTQPPFGSLDTPMDGGNVNSSVPVTGWVLDDVGVDNVKIYRNNNGDLTYLGDANMVEGARPDIQQAYPDYPQNYQAGWGYMMLTNFLPNGGNGTHTLTAVAQDVEGNSTTLGSKTIHVDNTNAVKPFGAIDTPAPGGKAFGSSYRNWGWALTPPPNMLYECGSDISVIVDGQQVGNVMYNVYRPDIAAKFPGYANANGAGGYFFLDTTPYDNGVHSIQWTATDNAGNTDGIGSRYFSIENTSNPAPQPNLSSIRVGAPESNPGLLKASPARDQIRAVTPYNRYFQIFNKGQGTLDWQVSTNDDWITLAPESGTGPAWIQVMLDPAGLPAGQHKGIIKIEESNGVSAPEYVTVDLEVLDATEPPLGEFSYPAPEMTVSGNTYLHGWALDDVGIHSVKIYRVDGEQEEYIGDASLVEGARADVAAFYAHYPLANRAGWTFPLYTYDYDNGPHTFAAHVTDYEGNETILQGAEFIIDNANGVLPFGEIESPAEGEIVSGDNVEITGWLLAQPPSSMPTDGSSIFVKLNGEELGSPIYNQSREDIGQQFPEHVNSDRSGFTFYLDTTPYPDGDYTLNVMAWDDSGHTSNAIGVRNIKIVNTVITRVEDEAAVPKVTDLLNAYPNPFNPATQIEYHLATDASVSVHIYDILGRRVRTLVDNQYQQAGRYHIRFNSAGLASGVYFCRFITGHEVFVKKLMLMK